MPFILALVTDAWGGEGGIAQYNRDLLGALAKDGNPVDVISLMPASGVLDLPVGISQSHSRSGRVEFAVRALKACIKKPRAEVIWCGHINVAPLAYILCLLFRIPMWLQVHGIDAWESPGFLRRLATERATLVTAVSRFTRRKMLSWANLDPEKIKVLPNTVDESFSPGPKSAYLIDRYGLQGKRVLLTVGRLSSEERYKGHDRVIESLASLTKNITELVYLIVGDGPDKGRLRNMVKNHQIEEHVVFAGRVPSEELLDHYRVADVFVMPSSGEGFGIVFLEAANTGLPVVALKSGGSMDALRDGESGVLARADEGGSIADAIELAFENSHKEPCSAWFNREHFQHRVNQLMQHLEVWDTNNH